MPREIHCFFCNKKLEGGLDTFGPIGMECCWEHYAEHLPDALEPEMDGPWYGLAPHHHDLSRTGSVIGSTVFDPLPERDENGEYDLGNVTFVPDPDAPGCGIYTPKRPQGWS